MSDTTSDKVWNFLKPGIDAVKELKLLTKTQVTRLTQVIDDELSVIEEEQAERQEIEE
ncbi:MAG TPA: hypothetical protein VD999_05630 [Vitreimonas sp.]|nr:hypothetical protein [Vitreimonas sp.]